jgi:hypothetical protein
VQIQREVSAFDINRRFPDLVVMYRGRDLTAANIGLSIAQVKIVNSGDVSLSDQSFSQNDPLGLRVHNGTVVGLLNSKASSSHLARRAMPRVGGNTITIPTSIVMGPRDYIGFDLLILKPSGKTIGFQPLGKVVGQKEIAVQRFDQQKTQESFWWSTFSGGPITQFTRLISYFLFGVILIAFIIGVVIQFSEVRSRTRRLNRKKMCSRVRALLSDVDGDEWLMVSWIYVRHGKSGLGYFQRYLARHTTSRNPVTSVWDDDIDRMPSVPERKNESNPQYIKRALDRRIPLHLIGQYASTVALVIGINYDEAVVRDRTIKLVDRLERRIEEVAVEAGIKPTSLEKNEVEGLAQELVFDGASMLEGGPTKMVRDGRNLKSSEATHGK